MLCAFMYTILHVGTNHKVQGDGDPSCFTSQRSWETDLFFFYITGLYDQSADHHCSLVYPDGNKYRALKRGLELLLTFWVI